MKITLLRHGQTEGNLLGQYVGSSDVHLCEEGRHRAGEIPPRTDVQHVYTSGLRRTVQTALLLYPGAEITGCEGFDEMDFGLFEQKSWRDLEHDAAYRAWVDSGCETACPDGENKASFTKRCVDTFLFVAQKEASENAHELHCVVHGGTIMAIMSELAEPIQPYFSWTSDFCGGYRLAYDSTCTSGRPLRLIEAIRPKEGSEKP